MKKCGVGIIGCGNISAQYLRICGTMEILDIKACADLNPAAAQARAKEFSVPKACGVEELLADPDIEIVINLTIPGAHGAVALQAIEAGKSVYTEKPLSVSRAEGLRVLQAAKKKKVLVGNAPDTFFGAGLQTCRKILDEGLIGNPIGASAFVVGHGHESWHPAPDFYYKAGGGPMFDMGPYYLTALVMMLGPVARVAGSAKISFAERTITSQPKAGSKIKVETPTHFAGVLDFVSGVTAQMGASFDVWAHNLPQLEIYGTEGSLSLPDPNGFGGPVRVRKAGEKEWQDIPHSHAYAKGGRGLGVADMAYALRSGRPHRASGELAFHVLDIMEAFVDSSREDRFIKIASSCSRPAPLPAGLKEGTLDP